MELIVFSFSFFLFPFSFFLFPFSFFLFPFSFFLFLFCLYTKQTQTNKHKQINTAKIPICNSVCQNFLDQCTTLFQEAGYASFLPPNCNAYPIDGTATCETLQTTQIPGRNQKKKKKKTITKEKKIKKKIDSLKTCQPPFLENPDPSANYSNCYGACCLPCPTIDAFYPEGLYVRFFTVLEVFSMISFFSILFVLISYAVLPERRRFPQVQEKEKKTKIKIKIK